ncbi:MAG TPA: transporter, partial [Flavobacteriales bacterium]|nr:transporter [Flavobacteriales bacterium]
YDTLSFDFENEDTPDSKTVKNWQNTPTHRIGVALDYKETISVRAGLYIDKTPIEDGYV